MNAPQYEMLGNKPGNVKIRNIVLQFIFPFNYFSLVFREYNYRHATLVSF